MVPLPGLMYALFASLYSCLKDSLHLAAYVWQAWCTSAEVILLVQKSRKKHFLILAAGSYEDNQPCGWFDCADTTSRSAHNLTLTKSSGFAGRVSSCSLPGISHAHTSDPGWTQAAVDALSYVEGAFALAPLFDESRLTRLRRKAPAPEAVKRHLSNAEVRQGVLTSQAMH